VDPSRHTLGNRLLIIAGDEGRPGTMVRDAIKNLPEATAIWLADYFSPPWADAIADLPADVESALLSFLSKDSPQTNKRVLGDAQGTVAGITYHSQGEGP